jgi:hypothetical protein
LAPVGRAHRRGSGGRLCAHPVVAVPFDNGDVGNWLEPLGLVALFAEVAFVTLTNYALVSNMIRRPGAIQ